MSTDFGIPASTSTSTTAAGLSTTQSTSSGVPIRAVFTPGSVNFQGNRLQANRDGGPLSLDLNGTSNDLNADPTGLHSDPRSAAELNQAQLDAAVQVTKPKKTTTSSTTVTPQEPDQSEHSTAVAQKKVERAQLQDAQQSQQAEVRDEHTQSTVSNVVHQASDQEGRSEVGQQAEKTDGHTKAQEKSSKSTGTSSTVKAADHTHQTKAPPAKRTHVDPKNPNAGAELAQAGAHADPHGTKAGSKAGQAATHAETKTEKLKETAKTVSENTEKPNQAREAVSHLREVSQKLHEAVEAEPEKLKGLKTVLEVLDDIGDSITEDVKLPEIEERLASLASKLKEAIKGAGEMIKKSSIGRRLLTGGEAVPVIGWTFGMIDTAMNLYDASKDADKKRPVGATLHLVAAGLNVAICAIDGLEGADAGVTVLSLGGAAPATAPAMGGLIAIGGALAALSGLCAIVADAVDDHEDESKH